MCGRYTLTAPAEQLALRFDLDPASVPAVEARYNIAPSQPVPVVVARPDGRLAPEWMRWGFQPAWASEARRPAPINARAETCQCAAERGARADRGAGRSLLMRPLAGAKPPASTCFGTAAGSRAWLVEQHATATQLRAGFLVKRQEHDA